MKLRSRSNSRVSRATKPTPPPVTWSGRVSGRPTKAQISTAKLATEMKTKIDCQPSAVSSNPPISGASMGATTITVVTHPIIEAARSRS